MTARYEIFQGVVKQYYFRLRAANGEIILKSEGYWTYQGVENGVGSVRVHSPYDGYYVRARSQDGRYYFTLRATNNHTIGMSQLYSTATARDRGIDSVKLNGARAPSVRL